MAATSRVVVRMAPDEKAALDANAKRAGISSAELVRRAVDAYETDAQEAKELRAVLALFNAARTETLAQLDRTDQKLDATLGVLGG